MHPILLPIILFFFLFFSPDLEGQVLYFPSRANSTAAQKHYQEAVFSLMNFEHKKFSFLIENIIASDPTCFKAYAHRAFHQFHVNGNEYPFEKYAKKALAAKRQGEEEKVYAQILEEKLKNPEADISNLLIDLSERHNVAEAYFLLGNYYLEIGELEKAHASFYRIFKIDKKFPPAFNLMGHTSMELGYKDLANDFLTEYVNLQPNNPNAHDSYGDFLVQIEDYETSIKEYERAYELSKNYKFALEKANRIRKIMAAK